MDKVFQSNHTGRCRQDWITVSYRSGGFPQSLLMPNLQSQSEENILTEINRNFVWWRFFILTLGMQDTLIPVGLRFFQPNEVFWSKNVGDPGLHSVLKLATERNLIHFQSKGKKKKKDDSQLQLPKSTDLTFTGEIAKV